MEPRHRPPLEPSAKPRPNNNIGTLFNTADERTELSQIVAAIGIREDDHLSGGGLHPSPDGPSIATSRLEQNRGAGGLRRGWAAVAGAVVHDDHLAGEPSDTETFQRLLNHNHHTAQFVEAGQDDRNMRKQLTVHYASDIIDHRGFRGQRSHF